MTTILVTGSQGIIGSVLCPYLMERGYRVIGLDSGLFADCTLGEVPSGYEQITADIRDVDASVFKGVDCCIHLAALSNDPLGELDRDLTCAINQDAAVRLASLAQEAGVKRFVFSSTQSMYGKSDGSRELTEDDRTEALTAYALSKGLADHLIRRKADGRFTAVALRPATVFGPSPRFRSDIVFNNLVAQAYCTGKIVLSTDGTPWRPVVHILDLCEAFRLALEAPAEVVNGNAYNVSTANASVWTLALTVKSILNCEVVNSPPRPNLDERSYRVSSERIRKELGWMPTRSLDMGGEELVEFFRRVGFTEQHMNLTCNRLATLKAKLAGGELTKELRKP